MNPFLHLSHLVKDALCDRPSNDVVGWLIVGWLVMFVNCGSRPSVIILREQKTLPQNFSSTFFTPTW